MSRIPRRKSLEIKSLEILTRAALPLLAALSACSGAVASHPPPPRAVRVAEARAAAAEAPRRYAGTLEPRLRLEVAFRAPGRVRSVGTAEGAEPPRPLQEGDLVRRGQVLARLDETDLGHQADAAQASLASAQAELRAARSALEQARTEAGRARRLAASGTLAPAELERAEAALAAAQGRLDGARGQASARAQQLALARQALADAALRSPEDAVVARRNLDAGESAAPGVPAFVLIDTREMRFTFALPDRHLAALREGAAVDVEADALPGRVLPGVVRKIGPVADPVTRTFTVEVAVDNAQGLLRAGMVAAARLERGGAPAGVVVPLAAVQRTPEGFAVFAPDETGSRAVRRPVEPGELVGNDVLVAKGLSAGDRVVVEGAAFLADGQAIRVRP